LGRLSPSDRQVAHVLRTRSPVALASPRDLHVLSTPPAFVLSQDQTLQWIVRISSQISLSYAVVSNYLGQRHPNHKNVRFKLSPTPRTGLGSTSSPRTSSYPKFNYQKASFNSLMSLSATAFNHTRVEMRSQAENHQFFAGNSRQTHTKNHASHSARNRRTPRIRPPR
jgi:hypothetical protein